MLRVEVPSSEAWQNLLEVLSEEIPKQVIVYVRGGQLLSLGRIVTMDMATVQYIDNCECFKYVEFLFLFFIFYITPGSVPLAVIRPPLVYVDISIGLNSN